LFSAVNGFEQAALTRCHGRGRLIRSSDYPKRGLLVNEARPAGQCAAVIIPM
jgi:hypothetical protein